MVEGEQKKVVFSFGDIILERKIFFGNKTNLCPQRNPEEFKKALSYYMKNSQLIPPCNTCYRTIIYWVDRSRDIDNFTEENLRHLEKLVNNFRGFEYLGKISESSVSFYFDNKEDTTDFYFFLQNHLNKYNVSGILSWEKACSEYRRLKKELWKNPQEFRGSK